MPLEVLANDSCLDPGKIAHKLAKHIHYVGDTAESAAHTPAGEALFVVQRQPADPMFLLCPISHEVCDLMPKLW